MAKAEPVKHKPLERMPSAPKVLSKATVNFPTKKLRMRSLLWTKPSGIAVNSSSSFLAQLFPTLIVNIAAISVGLGYGFNTVITSQLKDNINVNGTSAFATRMDDDATSWIAGMFGLGAIVGGFASALIGYQVGRRRCMLFLAVPDTLGWVLIAASVNLYMVYVGRFLTGFAAAGYIASILIYVAEISQPQHRGLLSALTIPAMALGTLVSYCLGYIIPWHFVAIIGIVIPVVLLPGLLLVSNSPHWYLHRGEEKLAVQAMEKFRSSDANGLSELLAIADVLKQGRIQEEEAKSLTEWIKETLESIAHRKNRRPFLLVNALFLLMLLSGDFSISFYAVDIFKRAASGANSQGDMFISAVIVGCIRFIGSLLLIPAIKYCTRKVLLSSSSMVMGLSMAVLGFALFLQGRILPTWLPLLCVTIYMAVVPVGLGSLPYVYIGEFFSTEMRPLLSGITIGLAQLEMFVIVKTFPMLNAMLVDGGIFWMYSGVCFAAAVFTLLFVPETKGKSLEEIESHFSHKRNLHVTPYATPMQQRRSNGRPHPLQIYKWYEYTDNPFEGLSAKNFKTQQVKMKKLSGRRSFDTSSGISYTSLTTRLTS